MSGPLRDLPEPMVDPLTFDNDPVLHYTATKGHFRLLSLSAAPPRSALALSVLVLRVGQPSPRDQSRATEGLAVGEVFGGPARSCAKVESL